MKSNRYRKTRVSRAACTVLLCVLSVSLVACEKESPLQEALAETGLDFGSSLDPTDLPSPGSVKLVSVEPVFHERELLDNPAFGGEAAGTLDGWMTSQPACIELKTAAEAAFVELKGCGGAFTTLEQTLRIHPTVRGLPIRASAEIRCELPQQVVLRISFTKADTTISYWDTNTGSKERETLELTAIAPAGFEDASVTFQLGLWSGAMVTAEVFNASAMISGDDADVPCAGVERVWNGSFERWSGEAPDGWNLSNADARRQLGESPDGALSLSLQPSNITAALEQTVALPPCALGKTIRVSTSVKQEAAGLIALIVYFTREGQRLDPVVVNSTGGTDWETVTAEMTVPTDVDPNQVVVRIGQRPDGAAPTLIDRTSVRVIEGS